MKVYLLWIMDNSEYSDISDYLFRIYATKEKAEEAKVELETMDLIDDDDSNLYRIEERDLEG